MECQTDGRGFEILKERTGLAGISLLLIFFKF